MNVVRVKSFVRGYHVYLDTWEAKNFVRKRPESNSSELSDEVQPINSFIHPNKISHDNEEIGHICKLMALWVTKFLKRPTNSEAVVITGTRINKGPGYGVELP